LKNVQTVDMDPIVFHSRKKYETIEVSGETLKHKLDFFYN